MHTTTKHSIVLAALLALTILGYASQVWAKSLKLGVHKNKIINGFEAELRGDYQVNNGTPQVASQRSWTTSTFPWARPSRFACRTASH
jgi:hypothetical protein